MKCGAVMRERSLDMRAVANNAELVLRTCPRPDLVRGYDQSADLLDSNLRGGLQGDAPVVADGRTSMQHGGRECSNTRTGKSFSKRPPVHMTLDLRQISKEAPTVYYPEQERHVLNSPTGVPSEAKDIPCPP